MMAQKEDLGLSLSLGSSNATACARDHGTAGVDRSLQLRHPPLQLNLMSSLFSTNSSSLSTSSVPLAGLPFASAAPQKNHFNDCFISADRALEASYRAVGAAGEPKSFLKGIDVNRRPPNAAEDEEAGVSSPNSTISSLSGKRSEREATVGAGDGPDAERACSRGISDEEDGETSRKKLRLSKDQSALLEESFKEHNTLNPKQKMALAQRLGLRPRQVEVWFQNRRARTKLKQTEVDCEFLKRCCEQLTEENRRLQKEVHELRALKLSPQFYMQMTPPTTLTMCPSCERVAAPPSAATAVHRPLPTNPWGVPAGHHMEALRP